MPAMFKANERCYNRTFGLYGLETLNHRSELKILWDTFRSQIAELWFPYDRRIASQTIAEDSSSIFCDRLRSRSQDRRRSQKCVSIWSQTIAELSAICDLRSAIVCDHMSTEARTSSENVTSRFCNHFSIIQSHYAWKMCSNYPGIKLEPALGT